MALPETLISPIVVDIAAVLALAAIVVLFVHRVRLSPVVGYLLTGILIGVLAPPLGFLRDRTTIASIATLGVILLIFNIGLELDLRKVRKLGLRILAIASVEIVLVFIAGYWAGILLGWTFVESVFLGAILSNTGTTIIMKSLIDAEKITTEQGQLVMALLVVEDLSVIIFLTLLSSLTATVAIAPVDLLISMGRVALFAAVAVALGLLVVPRVVDYVARLHLRELLLITVLGMCFGMSVFAVAMGLTPAVGALVMGVLVAESKRSREVVRSVDPLRDVFVALFFISMGLLVDLSSLITYLFIGLILTAVFLVAKLWVVSLTSALLGTSGKTAIGVGLSMLAVGEFSLLLAKLGQQDLGVTRDFLFPVTMVMVLVTGVFAPSAVRKSDKVSKALFQRLPLWFREYGLLLPRWTTSASQSLHEGSRATEAIHHDVRSFLGDVVIITLAGAVAWLVFLFQGELSSLSSLEPDVILLVTGLAFVVASLRPFLHMLGRLRHLLRVTTGAIVEASASARVVGFRTIHKVLLLVLAAVTLLVGGMTASVFLASLVELSPLLLLLVAGITVAVTLLLWDALRTLHMRAHEALQRPVRLEVGLTDEADVQDPEDDD